MPEHLRDIAPEGLAERFSCTMGGVPIEFMGSYVPAANPETSDATNS